MGYTPDVSMGYTPDVSMGYTPDVSMGYTPDVSMGYTPDLSIRYIPDVSIGYKPDISIDESTIDLQQPTSVHYSTFLSQCYELIPSEEGLEGGEVSFTDSPQHYHTHKKAIDSR